MDVEVVTDYMPADGLGIGGNNGLHVGQKIFLRARGSSVRGDDLSRHHIAAENDAARAMALILEFASLHFSGGQRQSWMFALKRLNAGELVCAHRPLALLSQGRRIVIDRTNALDDDFFLRICWWGEPVADQMGLQVPLFKSRAACRGEMCWMMPRCITSSAISRPVQCVIGRPLGCSHANAINWQVCSIVM